MNNQEVQELDFFQAELDNMVSFNQVSLMEKRQGKQKSDFKKELQEVYHDVQEIQEKFSKAINIG